MELFRDVKPKFTKIKRESLGVPMKINYRVVSDHLVDKWRLRLIEELREKLVKGVWD